MRKGRLTEEQIIKIEGAAAGLSASDLCRKHGISDATFYKWRSRYPDRGRYFTRECLGLVVGVWFRRATRRPPDKQIKKSWSVPALS